MPSGEGELAEVTPSLVETRRGRQNLYRYKLGHRGRVGWWGCERGDVGRLAPSSAEKKKYYSVSRCSSFGILAAQILALPMYLHFVILHFWNHRHKLQTNRYFLIIYLWCELWLLKYKDHIVSYYVSTNFHLFQHHFLYYNPLAI